MKSIRPAALLKTGLLLDAAGSGAMALLQLAAADLLAERLVLPQTLLVDSGIFMAAYALLLLWLARLPRLWPLIIGVIIVGNVGWATGCVALWASGTVAPGTAGVVFLAVHATSVLLFAALQAAGLRRSRPDDAPVLAGAH